MAHVLVVVSRRFNGHELWLALKRLQDEGHTFELVATSVNLMDEVTFEHFTIEKTFDDIPNLEGYDALMFISGNMADTELHWRHKQAQAYVVEAVEKDLPIAAICCSVPSIRKAAHGKKVSYFPLHRARDLLLQAGAILTGVSYMVDGKLVTAEHQMATEVWAENFCAVLAGEVVDVDLEAYPMPGGTFLSKPDPDIQYLREVTKRTGKTSIGDENDNDIEGV